MDSTVHALSEYEADQKMWKHAIYPIVDALRLQMQALTQGLVDSVVAIRVHFPVLTCFYIADSSASSVNVQLQSFILLSTDFYTQLIRNMAATSKLLLEVSQQSLFSRSPRYLLLVHHFFEKAFFHTLGQPSKLASWVGRVGFRSQRKNTLYLFAQRCYICIGDLARYAETAKPSAAQDYSAAKEAYEVHQRLAICFGRVKFISTINFIVL